MIIPKDLVVNSRFGGMFRMEAGAMHICVSLNAFSIQCGAKMSTLQLHSSLLTVHLLCRFLQAEVDVWISK